MDKDALRSRITGLLPAVQFEEGTEWLTCLVDAPSWKEAASLLRYSEDLEMDFLFCVTGVDWKTHLSMVYHLRSTRWAHLVVVKVNLDKEKPSIATVSDIWRTAEFHEREAYDLLGIDFVGHPDLRRLFMTDEWIGWPLRKDYEDPVNMIRL